MPFAAPMDQAPACVLFKINLLNK